MIPIPELVKKYYEFPFNYDGWCYVWDSAHHMCLMKVESGLTDNNIQKFVDILNGTYDKPFNINGYTFSIKDGKIFVDDKPFLIVRGWGRLQYVKDDNPAAIQDAFGQWVVDCLTNATTKKS